MSDALLVDHGDPSILVLTLNRPEVLNAVTVDMQSRMHDLLLAAAHDDTTRVVVLTGAGERAFSAGYDIEELTALDQEGVDRVLARREGWIRAFFEHPLPIVAAVNGLAIGVGAILAACADVRIGGPRTSFKISATHYGGANLTWRLPYLIGWAHAGDLLLTGRKVESAEAHAMGLLTRRVAEGKVVEVALSTAREIAAHPPEGVREIKRLVREAASTGMAQALAAEDEVMRTTLKPRPMREIFSASLDRQQSIKGDDS